MAPTIFASCNTKNAYRSQIAAPRRPIDIDKMAHNMFTKLSAQNIDCLMNFVTPKVFQVQLLHFSPSALGASFAQWTEYTTLVHEIVSSNPAHTHLTFLLATIASVCGGYTIEFSFLALTVA